MLGVAWFWRRRGNSVAAGPLGDVLATVFVASLAFGIVLHERRAGRRLLLHLRPRLGARPRRAAGVDRHGEASAPGGAAALSWAGVAAIVYAILAFDETTSFLGRRPRWSRPSVRAALILAGTAPGRPAPRAPRSACLSTAPARATSAASLRLVPLALAAPDLRGGALGPRLSVAAGLLAVVASWVPTQLTHMLIEDPVRRAPALRRLPNRAIALGLAACMALAVGVGIGLVALQPTVRLAKIGDVPGAAALVDEAGAAGNRDGAASQLS